MRVIQQCNSVFSNFRFFSVLVFILTDTYLKAKFFYSIEFNGFTCKFFLIELSKMLRDLIFFLFTVFVVYVLWYMHGHVWVGAHVSVCASMVRGSRLIQEIFLYDSSPYLLF